MLKEVDKTSSDEPEGASWMARTPYKTYSVTEYALLVQGVFLFEGTQSISSTADVQGRALRPGSTPGAPLYQKIISQN